MDGVDCKGTGLYSGCVEKSLQDGASWNQKQATPDQVKAIVGKTEEAVRAGRLGIAFPIGYYSSAAHPV